MGPGGRSARRERLEGTSVRNDFCTAETERTNIGDHRWGTSGPKGSKEPAPSFGCACGLYARYEPIRENYLLPYGVGSVLAWGRGVHHEGRSFFRAEKALPIAFVRPRGGGGMYTREESEGKFFRVAELLGAEVLGAGGAARVHRARGEQAVVIKAGGEEKLEREEVVEPLEEPTPERRKEKVPEEESEKVPA